MCTYNIMASITNIIILITAIIVISGDALYVLSNDTDQPNTRVSDTSSYVKRDPPYMRRCDGIIGIFGCVTTDRSLVYPINHDYYDVMRPKDPSSPNTGYVISKHGRLRERRQAVVKTKGSDDGPIVVMSLLARPNSPLRSMIRNRNPRSSSIPETSSNKNTNVVVRQTPVSSRPPKVEPIGKNLILTFLTTLYSPYALIY
ncbi:uncharacterized protein LOC132935600 [Metopolophium dirhodum]|uniref:uncharacterized protein LOC132935600 n=1 Tax=Metopolophium dirhodum TaxID=44670 RepID=UPI00298FD588|nr:uncharacterized protein LOC132935600 [Metopolophium dirhodum]